MVMERWKALLDLDQVEFSSPRAMQILKGELGPHWKGEGVGQMDAGEARHQMAPIVSYNFPAK